MKTLQKRIFHIRWLAAVMASLCLLSCGAESETEDTPSMKKGYPSFGVGRPEQAEVPVPADDNGITICIDPGHGFDDVGCSSDYLTGDREEKDMTMLYAEALKEKLEFLGFDVILSHDGKTFPQEFNTNQNNLFSADERAAYINTLDVDYVISLHCDTFDEDTDISGSRVYYYDTEIKAPGVSSDGISNAISVCLAQEFPGVKTPSVHNNQSYIICRKTTMA
ncbi:MAG: N-acetylmuramoyl-L-alanine amidase, partial [Clostridia bacterium]|nr:N-acetylmuramoyl-L-alanine amidase [Clostridia bacterium]